MLVCARKVITHLVFAQAANCAAQQAEALAVDLGVNPDHIRIGADFLQVVMLWRAAKAARAGCFVAGTQVLTGYGPGGTPLTRSIEDLRPGDLVLSRSESDAVDHLDPRPVLGVSERTVYRLVHVDVADASGNIERLQTTAEHPFWVEGHGWMAAENLATGDPLLDDGGRSLSVAAVRIEDRPEGVAVYNLTVDADHTYFVEDGTGTQRFAWVHNAGGCDAFQGMLKSDARTFKRWLQSMESQGAAGARTKAETWEIINVLRKRGWSIPRGVETEWAGGRHINIYPPDGGAGIHLPVPEGFVL